jgi:serralysin
MAINIPAPSLIESVDAPSSRATSYVLELGQTAQGSLLSYADKDWYAISLVAGQTYSFASIGTGASLLRDSYLYLHDAQGNLISSNDDGGPYASSAFTYTALRSATYYLAVANHWSASSQYGATQYGISVSTGSKPNFDYSMGAGAITSYESWSGYSSPSVVTYGFRESASEEGVSGSYISSFSRLSIAQISAVNLALTLWSDVANIEFEQVNVGGYTNNATILIANYADAFDFAGAYANYPGSSIFTSEAGDVWLNTASGISTAVADVGTYTYETILHELGHAIGLSHPGDYNASAGTQLSYENNAQFLQDSKQYSVMSYFDATNTGSNVPEYLVGTPLMLDILALQNIYGANLTTRIEDTIYGFHSNAGNPYDFSKNTIPQLCIWDAGGVDTLDCSGYSQAQVINLGEGSFSDIGGYRGNISIALGAEVERTIGGSGEDLITGNALDNFITGKMGDDVIDGGTGIDVAVYTGAHSSYAVSFASSAASSVSDKTANRDGTDQLTNVERLSFTDGTLALDIAPGQNAGEVYRLYQAAFARTPDMPGVKYHLNDMEANGLPLWQIASNFLASPEFATQYGQNPTDTQYINALYHNVLNRTPGQSEVDWYQNQFNTKAMDHQAALIGFSESPENVALVGSAIANGIWLG